MTLRQKVFLHTYGLLALLTVAICAAMSVFLVMHHRNTQKQDGRLAATFIAKHAAKFILRDDRVGLKSLLDEVIQSNPAVEYAFVEAGHRLYVQAMQGGVPQGLLGLHDDSNGAAVVEVRNRKGEVVYDIGASTPGADAVVRLGLSRAAIDAQSREGLLDILAICATMLALSSFLAAWVASRVTRKVNATTEELRKAHDDLEMRVRERTKELQISESYYRELIDSAADAIFVHDMPSGDIIDCNRRACEALGYSREEMLRLSVRHIDASFSQERDVAAWEKLQPGMSATLLGFHKRKDNSAFPVEVNIVAITRAGRNMIVAVARDVTERTRAEETMRDSEEWYKTLFVEAVDGICLADATTGLIVDCNQALAAMVGRDKAELIGQPQLILHPPAGKGEPFSPTFAQHLSDRAGEILDTQVISKTGEVRDVAIKARIVNLAGRTMMYGLFRDVTDRKQAEKALRESEELYRSLVENIDYGITLIDSNRTILATNSAQVRLFGKSPHAFPGKKCFREFEYRDSICPHCPGTQAMASGQPAEVETTGTRDDGSHLEVKLRAFPLFGPDGAPKGFIEVVQDITEIKETQKSLQRAKEAAEAASRAKSEFLANMSHEIRTPMTAILGYADLMLAENVGHATRKHIDVIKRNGEHLLKVIGDILDLSKIEAGKLQIEPTFCRPAQVVADVVSLMGPQAAAKHLKLETQLADALPETVFTDPLRLRQILVNLVGNAIKFTNQGEVRIDVRCNTDGGRSVLRFDVTDTGIGMNEEQVGKLFQPFSQVDSSSTRKFGGTGLGLCVSQHLAEALGGRIEVRSELGKGSVFSVTIVPGTPDGAYKMREPALDRASTTSAATTDKIVLHGRILLAEDGFDNQQLISTLLRNAGAEVTAVENGQLAIEAALAACEKGEPFGVILMDMQMPVLDGYEATRQLRRRGYTGPIVALTAHAMAEDRQKCLDAGCDDYAAKPIDRRKLLATVARWAAHGRTHDAAVNAAGVFRDV